ncbi:MAG: hypothetical protein RL226_1603 [Bacteroidota bacterium]
MQGNEWLQDFFRSFSYTEAIEPAYISVMNKSIIVGILLVLSGCDSEQATDSERQAKEDQASFASTAYAEEMTETYLDQAAEELAVDQPGTVVVFDHLEVFLPEFVSTAGTVVTVDSAADSIWMDAELESRFLGVPLEIKTDLTDLVVEGQYVASVLLYNDGGICELSSLPTLSSRFQIIPTMESNPHRYLPFSELSQGSISYTGVTSEQIRAAVRENCSEHYLELPIFAGDSIQVGEYPLRCEPHLFVVRITGTESYTGRKRQFVLSVPHSIGC